MKVEEVANSLDRRTDLQKLVDKKVLERVKAGMKLLQEQHGEDWVDHIHPEKFDIRDGEVCVLGQVYEGSAGGSCGYISGIRTLGIEHNSWEYGFSINEDEMYEEGAGSEERIWAALQFAWMKAFSMLGVRSADKYLEQAEEQLTYSD